MANKKRPKAVRTIDGVTALAASVTAQAGRFITKQQFQEQFEFWGRLKDEEKDEFYEEGKQLAGAMISHGSSSLAIGKHLISIQGILKRSRSWEQFLGIATPYTSRTARRYMDDYEAACEMFPESVISAAAAKGMNLRKFIPALKAGGKDALPALPENPGSDDVDRYLKSMKATRRDFIRANAQLRLEGKVVPPTEEAAERTPKALQEKAFRVVMNALPFVPKRQQDSWIETHVGMILALRGITRKTFAHESIPDDFRTGRGRGGPLVVIEGTREKRSA